PRRIRRGPIEATRSRADASVQTHVIHGEFAVAPLKPAEWVPGRNGRTGHPRRIRRGPIEAARFDPWFIRIAVIHGEFAVAPLKPAPWKAASTPSAKSSTANSPWPH